MNQIALKALHKKYLEGNCSVSEKQILLEILVITPDDQLMDFEEVLALTDPGVHIDEDISEAIYNKIVAAQPHKRSNHLLTWQRAVAAAIVFITLSALASYLFWNHDNNLPTYTNHTNFIKEITLGDKSTVLLRPGSSLKILSHFDTDSIRQIKLNGEAFFYVQKNAHKPFIVADDRNFDVKVLGTEFNLISDESEAMLVLNSGLVEVSKGKIRTKINPGEKVSFEDQHQMFRVEKVDTSAYSAWKYNLIYFDAVKLSKIIDELKETYPDQSFHFSEKYADYHFSGYLPQHDLDKTINLLNKAYNYTIITK
ncbi:fec operon regulator FecR [Sphingobacterium spiritivorum]|uniref:Fec operon regulator FecR n=1 Tax=Sphingobacterium spiritivorum TaxID=258 RepID=A0A380C5V3_SPHSI|nr:FecR domain-containing protein [Sphingobacterium spiritivorum]SUJ12956.1 fec operon regulator FecR [Sphingobacterium spiritivorum]